MKKNSTLIYAINDFDNVQSEIYDAEEILSKKEFAKKYSDVTKLLDGALVSPSRKTMNAILNAAK